jgi:hypothetical protein
MHPKRRERIDEAAAERELGPLILRGRNRIGWKAQVDLGQSLVNQIWTAFVTTVIGPFIFIAVPLGLFSEVVLGKQLEAVMNAPGAMRWIVGAYIVQFVVFLVSTVGSMVWTPRRPVLTLFTNGFCYDGRPVRFDELRMISVGRPRGSLFRALLGLNKLLGHVSSSNRGAVNLVTNVDQASLTLRFCDGPVWCLPRVLVRIEPADVQKFAAFVRARHPQWLSR